MLDFIGKEFFMTSCQLWDTCLLVPGDGFKGIKVSRKNRSTKYPKHKYIRNIVALKYMLNLYHFITALQGSARAPSGFSLGKPLAAKPRRGCAPSVLQPRVCPRKIP